MVNAWMTHSWSASDEPYREIARTIYKELAQTKDADALYRQYQARATLLPQDPKANFALACLAIVLSQRYHKEYLSGAEFQQFGKADPLNVHAYAELRFAWNLGPIGKQQGLEVVGERLFTQNPHNLFVGEHLIDLLCHNNKLDEALKFAQLFIKAEPKDPGAYARMGQVCDELWLKSHDKQYLRQGIAAYQQYLVVDGVPVSEDTKAYQKWVRFIIGEYQKRLAQVPG